MAEHICVVQGPFEIAQIVLGVEHWYRVACSDCPWAWSGTDAEAALAEGEEHTETAQLLDRLDHVDREHERLAPAWAALSAEATAAAARLGATHFGATA